MLLDISSRILTSFSPLSLRTFVKHLPPLTPSFLKFNPTSAGRTLVTAPSASASAVNIPHFQNLTSFQKHQIRQYIDSLLQWNQKMNLTALKEENEVMDHVEDSLAIFDPIRNSYLTNCGSSFEDLKVVDVGSGAGLPGIILAIACPSWKVTLLESMNKRCVFLEHIIDLVGLQNVEVTRDRAELFCNCTLANIHTASGMLNSNHALVNERTETGQTLDFREGFDIAVARAVAEMRVLAEYCLPLVCVGGLFVAAKGHDPQWNRTANMDKAILCLKKFPTPRKYPRAPGTPSKLPR